MELPRAAGLAMVVGALIFIVAVVPMPNIYGIQDANDRLAKIYAGQTAFFISQALFAVGAIVAAVGFVLLTVWMIGRGETVLPPLGAVGIVVGAALWTFFMFDRATNPEGYFRDYSHVPTYVWVSVIASAVGLAAFSLPFIGADRARWVGYLTLGVVAITIASGLLAPEVTPPQLLYLPPLVIGSVLLLAGPSVLGAST